MFSKIKMTYSPNVQDFKFFPDTNYSDYFFSFPALLIAKRISDKSKGKHSRGTGYVYLGSKECTFRGNTKNKDFKS